MTDEQRDRHDEQALKHFESRLLEERQLVLRDLGVLGETISATQEARDGDLSAYRFHLADQGTDTMELEKNMLFASQEGRLLQHIDEALRRLYRSPETFGTCARCERLIDFDRLDAIPHATLCIACKQRAETAATTAAASVTAASAGAGAEPGAGAEAG